TGWRAQWNTRDSQDMRPMHSALAIGSRAARAVGMFSSKASDVTCDETASLLQLASAREHLMFDESGSSVDTRSDKGYGAAQQFLEALESYATALELAPASRGYRSNFYEQFAEIPLQRDYSVAVLEACLSLSRSRAIWANGQKFELSEEAENSCLALQCEWDQLLSQLDYLLPSLDELASARHALSTLLDSLDLKWADFEHCYFMEIAKVQHKAKGLVIKAIEVEAAVSRLEEAKHVDELEESAEYQLHVGALVECITRLNVAANMQRRSFDELTAEVREHSETLLRMCAIDPETPLQAARALARQALDAFEELRCYLRRLAEDGQLDDLNPQLCQNENLVAALMRWEESWIIVARYIQDRPALGALCKLIPRLVRATQLSDSFAQMCCSFDAELFLVLPRIVWLSYLAAPESLTGLISNLLPHRFVRVPVYSELRRAGEAQLRQLRRERSEPSLGDACAPELVVLGTDASLKSLQTKFNEVKLILEGSRMNPHDADASAWGMLLQCAVSGTGCTGSAAQCEAPLSAPKVAAVESLLRDLESWSMELQRHCAEDWNECINVLVKCLLAELSVVDR
ncbi:unnamed protein product, partial [Effrenium voratum]